MMFEEFCSALSTDSDLSSIVSALSQDSIDKDFEVEIRCRVKSKIPRFIPENDPLMKIRTRPFQTGKRSRDSEEDEPCAKLPKSRQLFVPIVKRDIRRYYGHMYLNCINSGDFATLFSFFCKYASPDLVYSRHQINLASVGRAANAVYVHGLTACIPDLTMHNVDTTIKQFVDSSTVEVTIRYKIGGNKLFHIEMKAVNNLMNEYQSLEEIGCLTNADGTTNEEYFGSPVFSAIKSPTNPVAFEIEADFVLTIDENYYIRRIENVFHRCKPENLQYCYV